MAGEAEEERIWTDSERDELAAKLDQDLDEFIRKAATNKRTPETNVELLEKDLKEHPAFINELPEDGSLPPLVEALQILKYDTEENSAEELAQTYKDDGNYNFKLKNYRFAIAAYTEGLKQKCQNNELNAQLYGNRAAAQFQLQNYRQCLRDCLESMKLQPSHLKVITRAINCCKHLKMFDEALRFCADGLQKFPDNETIFQLQQDLRKQKKINDRDERKNKLAEKRVNDNNDKIWTEIRKRKIRMAELDSEDSSIDNFPDINSLDSGYPINTRVHLNDSDSLIWPVIFFYPEYSQMDLIEKFDENVCFQKELEKMFSSTAPWDTNNSYKTNNLKIYFEDLRSNGLIRVNTNKTLLQILQHDDYVVRGGTPTFIILVNGSEFEEEFLNRYSFITT